MPNDACVRGNLILPDHILERGYLLVRGGTIRAVESSLPEDWTGPVLDAGEDYVCPGFVDLHVHGGGGADYMDGSLEAVRTANRTHLRHGTTTIFPTTTTGSPAQVQGMLQACIGVRRNWTPDDGARIGGVHFYGPYFAEDKVGCHSKAGRRDPLPEEYRRCLALGVVAIATCAAELPGAAEFYRAAKEAGCLLTCGHSNASWSEMRAAFDAGVRHVDHFWCAMSSVSSLRLRFGTPMQASMEQFVLANPEMSTEVIADGRHLAPELLEFAFRMKTPARLCLVTDSSRAVDMPPGRYRFGSNQDGPWIESDGEVGFEPGAGEAPPTLASSVIGLDTAVRTMRRGTSASLAEIVRMASLTPAERAGIASETGSLETGKRGDFLLLDSALQVRRVFLAGEEAFSAEAVAP